VTARRIAEFPALFMLPALFLAVEFTLRAHALPYWLWDNLDPSYIYLLNGMHILEGVAPGHVDHPGTPLQVLVALVLWLSGAGSPGAIGDAAFLNAEALLTRTSTVILIADAGAMLVLGWTVWRRMGALAPALFAETAPFVSMLALKHGIGVKPEPLLLFAVLLLAAAMVQQALRPGRWPLVAMAVAVGFGTACKVTFAPLGLAPLVLLGGWRQRWLYIGVAALAFLICIAPALGALGHMLHWFSRLAIGSGVYGTGPPTVIDPRRYPEAVARLFFARPFFLTVFALGTVVLVLCWRERHAWALAASPGERALAGILLAQLAQMLLVAKQPSAHYVLPALELTGPAAALVWLAAGELEAVANRAVPFRRAYAGILAVVLALQAVAVVRQDSELVRERDGSMAVVMARDFPSCAHVYRDLASSPALAWFDNVMYGSRRYVGRVAPMLPKNDYFSLSWGSGATVETWRGPVAPAELILDYPCIALRGTNLDVLRGLATSFGAYFDGAAVCRAGSEFVLAAHAPCPAGTSAG
jgi:hypothetical protein